MKTTWVLLVAIGVAGCATTSEPQEAIAVRDMIAVAELPKVDRIRLSEPLRFLYLNDHYVTASQRGQHYLIEFDQRCRNLSEPLMMHRVVDRRRNSKILRVSHDTVRGCRIDNVYLISESMLIEMAVVRDSFAAASP